MRKYVRLLAVPALVIAAACGRDDKPMDDGLRNDLSLASSMQPYQPQQFVSPMEMGYGAGYGYAQPYAYDAGPAYYGSYGYRNWGYGPCFTDEGYGRRSSCDASPR